jgi:hypothetical protein
MKLKETIFLKSDDIVLDDIQAEQFENFVGDLNEILQEQGMLLCYCDDKMPHNKIKFHTWDLRPHRKDNENE